MVSKRSPFSGFPLMWACNRCTVLSLFIVKIICSVYFTISVIQFDWYVKSIGDVSYDVAFCFGFDAMQQICVSHFWDFIHLYAIYMYGYTLNLCKQPSLRRLDTWIFAFERR